MLVHVNYVNINLQKPHPSGEGSGIGVTPQENLGLSENS